ncbi:hypothetical protein JOD54_002172 [Actinokineospora baliensis]|uniref:hypothetical protein n=1 Tax=Actinokineospora baliensis TaxID=547056 RepID=UPI00195B3E0F|nr:hypothetical protein [Actinokineospora baliensis]MBM7771968.1 hypothetical protein [Actinokineospora baliensis]
MTQDQFLPAPGHMIGPTWRRSHDGKWWLPQRTLGWSILNWFATYVAQPNGPTAGLPFLPTLEQARFILWWYAVDERGRFVYRAGILRRIKGWGKDPICAAMSLAELCGPTLFSHFDTKGDPVGKAHSSPWIQIAAVSQDQTRNTFSLFPAMATKRLREEFGLDLNKTVIYSRAGGIIEGVTSSPLALEGKRPTFCVLNEVQWWLQANDGHSMFNVIEGNITKSRDGEARYLAICNAHIPGQDSIGERLWDNHQAVLSGQAIDTRILYDALEAPATTPVSEIPNPDDDLERHRDGIEQLRAGIAVARGDATWLDLDVIIASILDINNPVSESRRKFLNQINASEDAWIAPWEWDSCQGDVTLEAGDRITLGFDGSKGSDHTALVACRISDGAIFPLKIWNPELHGGQIPRDDVDAMVHWTFARFDVVAFRADVREFEAYVDQWGAKYRRRLKYKSSPTNAVAFDMRGNKKRFALDCERFHDAVLSLEITHSGNSLLRQHILNARRHPTVYDAITIRKASKDSNRKIDAAVSAVLAFGARQEILMSKHNRGRKVAVLRG